MLQTLEVKLQKGLILYNPKTKLSNNSIKPKFFIVMEEADGGRKSLIIFMTTSRQARSTKRNSKRYIPINFPFPKKVFTNVLLYEYRDIPITKLNHDYLKKGIISESEIKALEKAVKSSNLPKNIKRRVLHKKTKKPKGSNQPKYQWLGKEEIEQIKRKLGLKTLGTLSSYKV
jgi:hypothetical protein